MIARHNGRKNTRINVRENSEKSRASRSRESSPLISSKEKASTTDVQTPLKTAKDITETIEVLNEKDDCGVEDFIKIVKKAHRRCSQKDLLLDLILTKVHRSSETRDQVHTD